MDWITQGLKDQFDFVILGCVSKGLGRRERIPGIQTIRTLSFGLLFSTPLSPFYFFWFWWLAGRVDIVDHHYPMPWNDLAIAAHFPRRSRLVIHWHSDIIEQKRFMWFFRPWIRKALNRADAILISSPHLLKASEFLPAVADKVHVVPFGIEVRSLEKTTPEQQHRVNELRKRFGRFVLSVGRLVPYKGYEHLIRAVAQTPFPLVIVGEGPLRESLVALAHEHGVKDRVHFWGAATGEDLKSLYHASAIFALASITPNEAFGLVQIEAMACGKAIINTSLESGVPWVARHEIEALTVRPGDDGALTRAIQRLMTEDALRQRLETNARSRALQEFDREIFLQRTNQIYNFLLQ